MQTAKVNQAAHTMKVKEREEKIMFINYNVNTGISINSYRQPSGYANSDVTGLVDDIVAERDGCCPLDGAKDALEDGSLWTGSDATPEILEEIHSAICEWEAENP